MKTNSRIGENMNIDKMKEQKTAKEKMLEKIRNEFSKINMQIQHLNQLGMQKDKEAFKLKTEIDLLSEMINSENQTKGD
jgi:hypothetical protein